MPGQNSSWDDRDSTVYFSGTPPASRTISLGMSEDIFLLSTLRILLLACCPEIQRTNFGSRQCTYCSQYAWKLFLGLTVTFSGIEVRLIVLWFPISIFCPFPCKRLFKMLPLLPLLFLLSPRLQCLLFLTFSQQQCRAQLISCLHDSVNLIHIPLRSLFTSGRVQDSSLAKQTMHPLDTFRSWSIHNCWFIVHLCLKVKKKPQTYIH